MSFPARPRKLADCRLRGAGTELFLVEGDSASSSVVAVCDPEFQAVLPMQGKPMNPLRGSAERITTSPLYAALIIALGGGVGAGFFLDRVRYDRVLLLMDPDADGIHCGVLLQMFFYRWMRPLLDAGRVQVVWAPMAEVRVDGQEEPTFAYTEPHLQSVRHALRLQGKQILDTVHHRGLGSMYPPMLARTCVAPATRTTVPLEAKDVLRAIEVFGGPRPAADPQLQLFGTD